MGPIEAVPPGEVQSPVVAAVHMVDVMRFGGGSPGCQPDAACQQCVKPEWILHSTEDVFSIVTVLTCLDSLHDPFRCRCFGDRAQRGEKDKGRASRHSQGQDAVARALSLRTTAVDRHHEQGLVRLGASNGLCP